MGTGFKEWQFLEFPPSLIWGWAVYATHCEK